MLGNGVANGDAKVALTLLDRLGLLTPVRIGSTTPEDIERDMRLRDEGAAALAAVAARLVRR
jgi:hypothetical protein